VNPIRPNMLPPSTLAGGERQDSGKLAAQRAFFQAALSQAQGAAAPAAASAPQTTAQVQRVAAAPAEQPQKILRPGSLIDIRV
jgi:acyl CoA:acetate/3-ketoacid CoA transferase